MPQERLALIAARRAFVEMKLAYMAASMVLDDDARGVWLRRQVRLSQAPEDLWWLRAMLIDAAREQPGSLGRVRMALHGTPEPLLIDSTLPALR